MDEVISQAWVMSMGKYANFLKRVDDAVHNLPLLTEWNQQSLPQAWTAAGGDGVLPKIKDLCEMEWTETILGIEDLSIAPYIHHRQCSSGEASANSPAPCWGFFCGSA